MRGWKRAGSGRCSSSRRCIHRRTRSSACMMLTPFTQLQACRWDQIYALAGDLSSAQMTFTFVTEGWCGQQMGQLHTRALSTVGYQN